MDTETGKVDILRYTAFIDAHRRPLRLCGRTDPGGHHPGHWLGAARGILYTTDGLMANSTFLDYRMPTTLDVPMIDAQIVEVPTRAIPTGFVVWARYRSSPRWPPCPTPSTMPLASA